jgi:thiol-disulfide isomerase/thioredoxin
MKNIILSAIAIIFVFCIFSTSLEAQVNWDHSTFNKIIKKANDQNKLVMIDFYTDWCSPCKQADKIMFTDDTAIVQFVNTTYISTKINAEKGEGIKLAKKYKVGGYPTLLFLDKNKNVVGRVLGLFGRDEYFEAIKTAGRSEANKRIKHANSETKKWKYVLRVESTNLNKPKISFTFVYAVGDSTSSSPLVITIKETPFEMEFTNENFTGLVQDLNQKNEVKVDIKRLFLNGDFSGGCNNYSPLNVIRVHRDEITVSEY